MNNLRKFATEAEYSAATLSYPAVSWVTSGDTLHYDLSGGTQPSVPSVKVAFTTDSCVNGKATICGDEGMLDIVSAITVNGAPLEPLESNISITLEVSTDYLIQYELMDDATDMGYQFTHISLPMGCASEQLKYDISFPEQVTNVGGLTDGQTNNVIFEGTTPPSVSLDSSHFSGFIYVPDSVVNVYKNTWYGLATTIHPISEYSGNLPI